MWRQRLVLGLGAVAIVLALIFPPFHMETAGHVVFNAGYAWLWRPPLNGTATVNVQMLAAEWTAIALVCAGMYLALRSKT